MSVNRILIVDRMIELLRDIKAGQVTPLGNTYNCDVALVAPTFIEIEELNPDEFPAVLVVPDAPATYTSDGELTYSVEWAIPLLLYVRDDNLEDRRHSVVWKQLELLSRDVILSLHAIQGGVAQTLNRAPNVQLSITSWQTQTLADEQMAWGVLTTLVKHRECPAEGG